MKNKLYLSLVLIASFVLNLTAQERALSSILEEFHQLGNTPLSEEQIINQNFNENEKIILNNHFAKVSADYLAHPAIANRFSAHEFYVHSIRSTGNLPFGILNGQPPFDTIDVIAEPLGASCFAGDFDENGVLYAITIEPDPINGSPYVKDLITIDLTNGAITVIGDLSGAMGDVVPTGLTYDFTTSTMYATTSVDLFEVDLTTAAVTQIGTFGTTGEVVIWLEIDNNGNAYAADVVDDTFYAVDLTTGAATAIGPLGVDLSFAQGATVDPETNELYMAGYQGGGLGGIHSINKSTGVATLIDETTPLDVELTIMSIEGVPVLGVSDPLTDLVTIYPNPMNDQVNVEFPLDVTIINAALYDLLGRITEVELVNGTINIANLKSGIYMLQLETDLGIVAHKLVKE